MKETASEFKLFADETRLRILFLLDRQELCVCQIMGVLGVSQPLVSRNLSLLSAAGLVEERRAGKLMFYRIRKKLPPHLGAMMRVAMGRLKQDPVVLDDAASLGDCMEFQKKTGRCDMKTFLEYMKKKKRRTRGV